MATIKYRFEYRINKKGCEVYRSEIWPDVLENFRRLNEKRPGVYTMQTRHCPLDRFGVRLKDAAGKSLWSSWQEVRS